MLKIHEYAEAITSITPIFFNENNGDCYYWDRGCYIHGQRAEIKLKHTIAKKLKGDYLHRVARDIFNCIKDNNIRPVNIDERHLCVSNGLIKLETGELLPFNSKIILCSRINAFYNPEIDTKPVKEYIESLFDSKEIQDTIQEIMGYCFEKYQPAKKAFYFQGPGDAGKSTFIEVLRIFLGNENSTSLSLKQICDEKFLTNVLENKMLNCNSEETKHLSPQNIETIKQLTGNDMMHCDIKHSRDAIQFKNTAKLIFAGNGVPHIEDTDEILLTRWLPILFQKKFPIDKRFIEKFSTVDMRSSILRYSLEGYMRLQKNCWKFTYSPDAESIAKVFNAPVFATIPPKL